MTSSASVDLDLMRASLLLDSDPANAAARASAILAILPGHAEATLLFAAASRKLADPQAAAAALESAANEHLDTPLMQLEVGRAYAAAGRRTEALAAFRRAVVLNQAFADAWRELAAVLFEFGQTVEGDAAYAKYSKLTPDPPELTDAIVAVGENRLAAAEVMLRRRLSQAPRDAIAFHVLADVVAKRGDQTEAERLLIECLEIAPGYATARYDLAQLLHRQQRSAEALPLVERLLAAEPNDINYLSLKAQVLRFTGAIDEAIAVMEQAVADHPDDDQAWLLRGHLYRQVGQQARAIEMYRRALAIRPQSGHAYASLANLKTFLFTGSDLAAMQEQLAHRDTRGSDRINLEFALGKALEDEGDFAASFEHYSRGNTLHRAKIGHDADAVTADLQRSKSFHTQRFFEERSEWGSGRQDPIFIVGLPRSGSTLLEQILASHSQIEGTGELMDVSAIAMALGARVNLNGNGKFPESLATLDRPQLEAYAEQYLSRTRPYRPLGKPRFVDKMLGNFEYIGFIHLMFPHAAIIDARRHPLGCGFSCYKQLFFRELGFTYDLTDLGRYYRDYADLMQHFDAVLPQRVHRVYYEHLVADAEGEVRRLLEYCGLPFEQQCLQFYDSRRAVQTISSEQVRRPIYTDAVDQWRHYEPWLGPLKAALGDWVGRYPENIHTSATSEM